VGIRIVGEPERLVDIRGSKRVSPHRFLLADPAAERWASVSDGRLRAEVWRIGPIVDPWRWDWALILTVPTDGHLVAVQGTQHGKEWQKILSQPGAPLHLGYLFDDTTVYNDAFGSRLYREAWRAAHGLYDALTDLDAWWSEHRPRTTEHLLTWASLGAASWAEARAWMDLFGEKFYTRQVQDWQAEGFAAEEVRVWADIDSDFEPSLSAYEAAAWHDAGVHPSRARYWSRPSSKQRRGYTASQGMKFERAGWTREVADYVRDVTNADRARDGFVAWSQSRMPVDRVVGYVGAGIPLKEAQQRERTDPPTLASLKVLAVLRGYPVPAGF
jgi:hypothetical protein